MSGGVFNEHCGEYKDESKELVHKIQTQRHNGTEAHRQLRGMISILIKNATIVNEGKIFAGDLLIQDESISEIGLPGQIELPPGGKSTDATGLIMIPGVN